MKNFFRTILFTFLLVFSSCYKGHLVASNTVKEVVTVKSSERQNLNALIMKYYFNEASIILIEGSMIVDVKNRFYLLTPRSSISLIKNEYPIYQVISK